MRRLALFAICCLVVAVAIAGCGSSSDPHSTTPAIRPPGEDGELASQHPDHGTIAGRLAVYGGVLETNRCGCSAAPGRIRFRKPNGRSRYVQVGRSGRFTIQLPVGRYRIAAAAYPARGKNGKVTYGWPMGDCAPSDFSRRHHGDEARRYFRVQPGKRTRVAVACITG